MVPSGTVSPTNVALAVQNLVPLEAVGCAARGVRVGIAAGAFVLGVFVRGGFVARGNGVSVTEAACVFCACTVSATEVAMIELLWEGPQDVKVRAKRIVMVKNRLDLNFICFLSFRD